MTAIEFARKIAPSLSDEEAEYVLWNWTAFPFDDLRKIAKQISQYVRSKKHHYVSCEFCGQRLRCPRCENMLKSCRDPR